MLRHAPIRSKVVAILTLPLVGLIALAAVGIGTTLARGAEAGRRNDLAQACPWLCGVGRLDCLMRRWWVGGSRTRSG
jgi:hypothetical protein